jgi:pimeloyl-ACP methyl ester carboxylesterase
MRKLTLAAILLTLLAPACTLTEEGATATPSLPAARHPTVTSQGATGGCCGDGVCEGPENEESCPEDCTAPTSPGPDDNTFWVTNPASQAPLYVQVTYPSDWDGQPLPALVLIPGGNDDSTAFTPPSSDTARTFADAGFAIIVFDPDGRGRSGGVEDQNGFVHQDGLAAVIRHAAALEGVDESRIGLISWSYGVTMAAGALARHDDLPICFFIDWEGPANRDDTAGCGADQVGHLQGHPCDDEDFWREREASTFALSMRVPYQRLQSQNDHAQPDNDHALLMIANATATRYGGHGRCVWTRLNDLTPNTVYDYDAPPPMMPDAPAPAIQEAMLEYVVELFRER